MKARQTKKPHRIHVQFVGGNRDGQVSKLEWGEAQTLIESGKAISLSRTLFRAARLGINIRAIKGKDRVNDSLIKEKMNSQRAKDEARQKKKESARQRVHTAE